MSKPFSVPFTSVIAILFACSAVPAFANHGGGGGGFHGGGGGGFHSSGGGGIRSSGGGGRSYSPPAAGYRSPAPQRSAGGFAARPSNNYSRPGGNFTGGNQRFGNSRSAPPAVADGQWHSFGGQAGSRGPSAGQSGTAPSGNAGGFHVFSGNRPAGSTGTVRSFSGQGGEVWENAPSARNVVPRSQSLATLHNSFHGSPAAGSAFRSNSTFSSATSRNAGGSALLGNRGFSGGVNAANSVQQLRGTNRFGSSFNGFGNNRFGRGCWNCGFGFGRFGGRGFGWGGWGWGFGWPWLGFGLWDPFWFDPWWGAGPAYGYGYYAYPDSNVYGYPDAGYSSPDDYSTPPPQQDSQYDQGNSNGNWVTPNGPSPSLAPNSSNLTVPVLIYEKNGSVLTVRDYWMIDGELHYILMSGIQRTVDLEQVDLPRTNTENARSGVKFIFKSEPSITSPAQPEGEPGSPNAPPPTQQIHAVPQPEART